MHYESWVDENFSNSSDFVCSGIPCPRLFKIPVLYSLLRWKSRLGSDVNCNTANGRCTCTSVIWACVILVVFMSRDDYLSVSIFIISTQNSDRIHQRYIYQFTYRSFSLFSKSTMFYQLLSLTLKGWFSS